MAKFYIRYSYLVRRPHLEK